MTTRFQSGDRLRLVRLRRRSLVVVWVVRRFVRRCPWSVKRQRAEKQNRHPKAVDSHPPQHYGVRRGMAIRTTAGKTETAAK